MMSWPVFGVPHFGRVHPWAEFWALPPESSTIPVSANIQLISRWAGKKILKKHYRRVAWVHMLSGSYVGCPPSIMWRRRYLILYSKGASASIIIRIKSSSNTFGLYYPIHALRGIFTVPPPSYLPTLHTLDANAFHTGIIIKLQPATGNSQPGQPSR